MQKAYALIRARLQLDAACERLRNVFDPPANAPPAEADDIAIAIRFAREALDAIEALTRPQP